MSIESGMQLLPIAAGDLNVGDTLWSGKTVRSVSTELGRHPATHVIYTLDSGERIDTRASHRVDVWRHPPPDPLALLTAQVEASDARLIALIEEHRAVAARVEALERRPVYSVVEGVAGTNGRVPTYAEWSATVVPTGGVVPSVVHPADKRCGATNGGYVCSRLVGHLHRHKAHEGHDVSARVCAEWGEEMEPEADPNAIGEWQRTADGWRRLFLHRPKSGAPTIAAADSAGIVRVWFDACDYPGFVTCTTRGEADALLARLYPTKEGAK